MARSRKVIGVFGERNRGKTTLLLKIFEAYQFGCVTIYDWDDDPMYDPYPLIELHQVKAQRSGIYKIQNRDWKAVIDTLAERAPGGKPLVTDRAILLEDITSYLPTNEYKPLTGIMGSCRKLGIDMFLTAHQINRCSPYVLQNLDMLILFKTSDNLDQVVKDSIRKPEKVIRAFERIKKSTNPHAYETVMLSDSDSEVPKTEIILLGAGDPQ